MIDWIKKMYKKYEELVNYIIVGVATTVVYLIACLIFKLFWDPNVVIENVLINTFGWLVGVIFAYFTNRAFVFKSKNPNMLAEFGKFTAGRALTWALDVFIMWLFVNALSWGYWTAANGFQIGYWVAKFISCVLVMVANYVISKLIVFTKKKEKEENSDEK